jgi:nitronate monooxygenase
VPAHDSVLARADAFAAQHGLRVPVLLAPMAGACPPPLSAAVSNAGGMGACGALLMTPQAIATWVETTRAMDPGPLQLNLWIPDPPPTRDSDAEHAVRQFLAGWGPEVPPEAADTTRPDFDDQCQALLDAQPHAISSIMGLYPPVVVAEMKARGILWFATATTVSEARQAAHAGADVIVAQGMEAGGHRGAFVPGQAERRLVGLLSLLPAVVDAVQVPVVAAGGIADARGLAAALVLGASAVAIGTGFLRCPEANLAPSWANELARTLPEDTIITCAFSGRPGRAITTAYAQAATAPNAPPPAPYPIQRALTQAMRDAGTRANDLDRIQAWAGQSASFARAIPAAELIADLWSGAQELLGRT